MLEFYHKFFFDKFKNKSLMLSEELLSIFSMEGLAVDEAEDFNIEQEYKELLGETLFNKLNNLYFTIRNKKLENHSLFRKYLPESRLEPFSNLQFSDFFSGAGGLGQGLINAGFTPSFANDIDRDALETYYFNHSLSLNRFFNGDIKELVDHFPKYKHYFSNTKIICGGPPCQGFSTANRWNFEIDKSTNFKRFIEDDRNILYKYFVKLLGLIKPDFFVMENVKGMMKVEKQIEQDIREETNQEYYFVPLELDAQNFNIPQSRKRYILVGGKNFLFVENIKKTFGSKKNNNSIYKLSDALYGLPPIGTNPYKLKSEYDSDFHGHTIRKFDTKQNTFLREINKNKDITFLFNHKSRYNNENDLEIFKTLPEGANSLHESIRHLNNYINRDHIFKDKYFKLKRDEVSKTITSHMKYDCHMYIHPEQARGLSPREAARIQTFPDDYFFRGRLNDWYNQIGNAVPVKLAEIIGNELIKYLR